MKNLKNYFVVSIILSFTIIVGNLKGQNQNFNALINESRIEWTGFKEEGFHRGLIKLISGTVLVNDGKITGGNFKLDLKNSTLFAEDDDKLLKHMKSKDFFNVDNFPTAEFTITNVTSVTENEFTIEGSLFFLGFTKTIRFNATVEGLSNRSLFCQAYAKINKLDFGLNYGKGHIKDQVQIAIYLFAKP